MEKRRGTKERKREKKTKKSMKNPHKTPGRKKTVPSNYAEQKVQASRRTNFGKNGSEGEEDKHGSEG